MSIQWNWRRVRDGEPLTKIRITHTLTREDLATLLIAAREPHTYDHLAELTRAEMERDIRRILSDNPDARNWWRDRYQEDYDDEPTADEVWEWAVAQAARL